MKILSAETVYTSKYFKITKSSIERNGRTYTKDFIERNSVVHIIPYTADNQIYMESQFRDALGKTCLEIVAGTIEEGGDSLETAKRELLEETGLTAKTWHKIAMWDLSVNMKSKIYVFAATDLTEGDAAPDEDEEIELKKMPLQDVLDTITSGALTGASHIASLLVFDQMRKEGKL